MNRLLKKYRRLLIIVVVITLCSSTWGFVLPREESITIAKPQTPFVDYDAKLYNLAYDVFLANKNINSAFLLTQAAVKQQPDSIKWRRRFANVSLWSGYSELSLQQMMLVLRHVRDDTLEQQALELAETLYDYQSVVAIYQGQLQRGVPMQKVWQGLTAALIHIGEPEAALAQLEKHQKQLPADQTIHQLALTLNQLSTALASLKRIEKKQGSSVSNTIAQVEILLTMGKNQQALKVLRHALPYASDHDKHYWQLLGALAWLQSKPNLALRAYQHLYELGISEPLVIRRWAFLVNAKHPEKKVYIALDNWRRSPSTSHLITALYASFEAQYWPWFYTLFSQLSMRQQAQHIALLIEWALLHKHYQLANFAATYAAQSQVNLPAWLQLSLAMQNNDKVKIAKLLSHPNQLSKSDQSVGAYQIGQIKTAQQTAYQALQENPSSTSAYAHFQAISLPYANQTTTAVQYRQQGAVGGVETRVDSRYYLSPHFFIQPFVNLWFVRTRNKNQLVNLPYLDASYGVLVQNKFKQMTTSLKVGQRQAVRSFFQARLTLAQSWRQKWRYFLQLGWQQNTDETTALLLGAKKNKAKFGASYQLTRGDMASFSFSYNQYHAQDHVFLGDGQNYQLSWTHQFRFSYPDWNVTAYTSVNQYQSSGNKSDVLTHLRPSTATLQLPNNFNDIGFLLGFGQRYQDDYTHAFRLYGEAGLLYNSRNGIGELANLGIAGSLFGRDRLALYGQFSRDQDASAEINAIIGLQYRVYY